MQFPFDGKLEGAQMIATFQPDRAENAVEVAESAFGGRLQMQPVIRPVTSFHDQMKPAWSRFAGHGYRVVFPAGLEMLGHLAFAKHPVTKPAFGRGGFVVHTSITYWKRQSGSSPFWKKSKGQSPNPRILLSKRALRRRQVSSQPLLPAGSSSARRLESQGLDVRQILLSATGAFSNRKKSWKSRGSGIIGVRYLAQ